MRQHTGFLWNASRVELSDPRDLWKLSGAAEGPEAPCASGLRPGHCRMVRAKGGGADFHFVSVHLDSGTTPRDRANRDTAIGRIAEALAPVLPDNSDAIVLGDFNTMGDGTPDAAAAEIRALGTAVVNQPAAFEHVAVEPACTEYFDGHAGWLDHVLVARAMTEASQRTARVPYTTLAPVRGAIEGRADSWARAKAALDAVVEDVRARGGDAGRLGAEVRSFVDRLEGGGFLGTR